MACFLVTFLFFLAGGILSVREITHLAQMSWVLPRIGIICVTVCYTTLISSSTISFTRFKRVVYLTVVGVVGYPPHWKLTMHEIQPYDQATSMTDDTSNPSPSANLGKYLDRSVAIHSTQTSDMYSPGGPVRGKPPARFIEASTACT